MAFSFEEVARLRACKEEKTYKRTIGSAFVIPQKDQWYFNAFYHDFFLGPIHSHHLDQSYYK